MTRTEQLVFGFSDDGGFVVGDRGTGRTTYAYPTNLYAVHAKKAAAHVARTMINFANEEPYVESVCKPYDQRNWVILGGR